MSGLRPGLTLGALGGRNTFGGDTAAQLMELYPEFAKVVYFKTAEEGFDFKAGGHDAMCAPQQMARTGFHPLINGYIADFESKLYVICDTVHVYHCALLVQPGTKLSDIKEVRGHTGSITQSRHWIEKHLPWAKIHIVHTSTHEAAREVTLGDGSIASVGTPGMAKHFELEMAATEIDGGSSADYWAVSPHPLYSQTPDRVVVAGRFDDRGDVGRIIGGLGESGYHLESVFNRSSTLKLYEYDYVIQFGGKGKLSAIQDVVGRFPAARLAGAYELRG